MRRIISIVIFFAAFAAHAESLFTARGFLDKKCYRHFAVRKCFRLEGKLHCDLSVFPETVAALNLPLDPARDFLLKDKETTDYGVFDFKVRSESQDQFQVQVLAVERVSLERWKEAADKTALIKSMDCPVLATK